MPYPNSFYAFRPYALELAKYFKKFLYTQAMMDYVKEIKAQGRNLTDKEKSIMKPVIMYATPKKAFAEITHPLLNGGLTSFGVSFYLSDAEPIHGLNGTQKNYIPFQYVDENEELVILKLSHPLAMKLTFNITFQTTNRRDMEELQTRFALELGEMASLKLFQSEDFPDEYVDYMIEWSGQFTNDTEKDIGEKDKQWVRTDTSITFPIAHFPQKVLEETHYTKNNKFYIKLVNDFLEEFEI